MHTRWSAVRIRDLMVGVVAMLWAATVLCGPVEAAERDPLVKLLIQKGVITEQEVRKMEADLAAEGAGKVAKEEKPRAELANALSKLKMKGHWAAGYFQSESGGSYPNGSFEVPEAKLQFAFKPDETYTVILRANLNNAAFNNLDYLYVDAKNPLRIPGDWPVSLDARLGRFKLDFGDETWSNNPVESALPSNSAANVAGSDEGAQIALTGKTAWSPRVVFGV